MSDLAERLKSLRMELGLTQRELASKVNLSPSTIALYELSRRTPDTKTTAMLADFFGVSVDYLLGRTDDRNPPKNTEKKYSEAQIAAWRMDGYGELPPEVQKQLEDYLEYVFTKYGKKDPDKGNDSDKTK